MSNRVLAGMSVDAVHCYHWGVVLTCLLSGELATRHWPFPAHRVYALWNALFFVCDATQVP
eukprot:3010771-Amphidinium_carterae.1